LGLMSEKIERRKKNQVVIHSLKAKGYPGLQGRREKRRSSEHNNVGFKRDILRGGGEKLARDAGRESSNGLRDGIDESFLFLVHWERGTRKKRGGSGAKKKIGTGGEN